jgi:hypothetical protein
MAKQMAVSSFPQFPPARLRKGALSIGAAALIWTEEATSGAEFVCLDQNLREAAMKEGFTVLPSSLLLQISP